MSGSLRTLRDRTIAGLERAVSTARRLGGDLAGRKRDALLVGFLVITSVVVVLAALREPVFSDDLLYYGGSAVDGIEFFRTYDRNSTNPRFVEFRELFMKRFHKEPGFASIHAYEAARVLLETIGNVGREGDVRDAILAEGVFKGLQDDIRFDRYGDVDRPMVRKTIRNGVLATVAP